MLNLRNASPEIFDHASLIPDMLGHERKVEDMTKKDQTSKAAPQFLRRREASAYLESRYGAPCSMQHLAKLAVHGDGPVFRKFGRYPVYEPADLDGWAERRLSGPMDSTSGNEQKKEENPEEQM
jgi:hypothetical protein